MNNAVMSDVFKKLDAFVANGEQQYAERQQKDGFHSQDTIGWEVEGSVFKRCAIF